VPYVVSPLELEAELKVPVINTNLVGIRYAETLVGMEIVNLRGGLRATLRLGDFILLMTQLLADFDDNSPIDLAL
jgi:hypothetical protein